MRELTLALFAIVLLGCSDRAFACTEDSDCGSAGQCEATGWCSFPDDQCVSGRRYGMHSGDGVAGVCVGELGEDSSVEASTGSASTTSGTPSSAETGSSGSAESSTDGGEQPVEESDATTGGCPEGDCDAGTTYDPREGGDSSTGDPDDVHEACAGWFEDFEDRVVDPSWSVVGVADGGHVMDEVGGELRWELGANYTGLLGLRRSLDPLSAVRIELGESPSTPSAEAQLVVLLREGDLDPGLYLLWFNGQLQLRIQEETIATVPEAAWVEIRFADDLMSISVSDDGETFDEVVTEDAPFDADALTLWLYGQTWADAPAPSVASLSSVRTCDPETAGG